LNLKPWFILLCTIGGTSCSVGPDYVPPPVKVPSTWKNNQEQCCQTLEADNNCDLIYLDHWWEVFEDEKLNELENLAIENNRDLFVAFKRIEQARALMGIAASDFYPQITFNPQSTNTGELVKNYVSPTSLEANLPHPPFRAHEVFYYFPFNLSYEVDLWGKIRDQYASAKYNWLAKKEDYEAVMLTLTSNLATAYYQLRTADAESDLLQKTLKTRQKALEINQARYDEKITFYADVTLAAEEVDTTISQYEEVRRQRDLLEDQIAVLIGLVASEFCLEPMPLQGLPPCIPEGIPSELLLRRPDIAEAEYNARSQHALVKQAYSLFFPSLTLTGTLGFESPILKEFMKWISRFWMYGEQVNQVIFDGFKTPYNLSMQIAIFQEASGEYQQQVLTAFREVEDALASLDSYAKQYEATLGTTEWGERSYQLYNDRYKAGVTYYIDVVNTERDLLTFQINLNSIQGFRYLATIQLIKALGGSWSIPETQNMDVEE
jgi:outer membrane protein, multidrug efflux system